MLVKRHGGTKKSSVLHVPVADSSVARSAVEGEEREMKERIELKRLVLRSVDADEEAARQARVHAMHARMVGANGRSRVVYSNRGRRGGNR